MDEWTYLEDLALTKPQSSTEFQWLLKSKGAKKIEIRRAFLLTASDQGGATSGQATCTKTEKMEQKLEAPEVKKNEDDMGVEGFEMETVGDAVNYI